MTTLPPGFPPEGGTKQLRKDNFIEMIVTQGGG